MQPQTLEWYVGSYSVEKLDILYCCSKKHLEEESQSRLSKLAAKLKLGELSRNYGEAKDDARKLATHNYK